MLSVICLPSIKAVWFWEISSLVNLVILLTRILVNNLYIRLAQEIGLKSVNSVVVGVFWYSSKEGVISRFKD